MSKSKLAYIFPGQGSQYVSMGKTLLITSRWQRIPLKRRMMPLVTKISSLCFNGPEADLKLTYNTQPAILTASIAALRVLSSETTLKPSLLAGHSLGEYSALVAADVLNFRDAVPPRKGKGKNIWMRRFLPGQVEWPLSWGWKKIKWKSSARRPQRERLLSQPISTVQARL